VATADRLNIPSLTAGRARDFSSPYETTHPPVQWVRRTVSPELKQPESEADHSTPSSAKVRNVGAPLAPPTIRHKIGLN
jgi:hypothetical protein